MDSDSADALPLERPIPAPPVEDGNSGWWHLPAMTLLLLLLVFIGLDNHGRAQASSTTVALMPHGTGPTVPLDLSTVSIRRQAAALKAGGMRLVETEEGVVAVKAALVPISPPGVTSPVIDIDQSVPIFDLAPGIPINPPERPARPVIAVIIDDMGLLKHNSARAIGLPGNFTLAFLPYADDVQAMADAARANGHEVMLHLPMAGRETADPGPHAMYPAQPADVQRANLERNLDRFTGYAGVNNHMGSRFTQDADGMARVLQVLKARGLFFIDSRTTAHSAARSIAARDDMAFAERDVFLDNEQDSSHIAIQLAIAEAVARRHGSAIAIGHPHASTIDALRQWQQGLAERGIDLVPVSRVIEVRKTPLWRVAIAARDRTG